MVYNHNIPKKQPKPKKSQAQIDNEKNTQYLDLIHARSYDGLTLFNAKRILGWGDGVFQRRTKDLKEGFSHEVEYVKKQKKFVSLNKPIALTEEALQAWNQKDTKIMTVSQQNRALLSG